jgi:hypothetical protein
MHEMERLRGGDGGTSGSEIGVFTLVDIPSSTPCDGCGRPANWIVSTGVEEYVWCDDCHAKPAAQAVIRTLKADEYGGEP